VSFALLCSALALIPAAGCGGGGRTDVGFQAREVGRPDAAWPQNARARKLGTPAWPGKRVDAAEASLRDAAKAGAQCPMDLSFRDKPALEVVELMRSRFGCEVAVSRAAAEFIRSRDLRVTSYASGIPANLAFETLRGLLEAEGLAVCEAPGANFFGPPRFLVDRSAVIEAAVPAR
jgi:hypothetical protein